MKIFAWKITRMLSDNTGEIKYGNETALVNILKGGSGA